MRSLFLLLSLSIGSSLAGAMSFTLQERCYNELTPRCQTMVLAEGAIDRETAAQFKTFTQTLPNGTWIAFTSPGGSLVGGMQLGTLIRERGFNTTIGHTDYSAASCLSACAYAFLGGLQRFIPPGSRYGLHQFRGAQKEIDSADTQKLSAVLARYIDTMGVDRRLLDIAQLTASDRVALLSPAQAKLYRVDNLGQSALPRWRLEASTEGRLLALNNTVVLGSKLPAIVAFFQTKSGAAASGLAALIFYRSDDAPAFIQPTPHRLIIDDRTYALQPLGPWQAKTGGYQASFAIPAEAAERLRELPESATIQIRGDFSTPPNALPFIELRLGVAGLKTALNALTNRANAP